MQRQFRTIVVTLCTIALLGLAVAGTIGAAPLYASDGAQPQAAPAQETPNPEATSGDIVTGTTDSADHAAHHPAASAVATGTATLSGTTGSMAAMGAMMESMNAVHQGIADDLAAVIDENVADMTPEAAAELSRIQGVLESMSTMMVDMSSMMGDPAMAGMMGAGMAVTDTLTGTMTMTDMMSGMEGMDHSMPMTGTMPMTGAMPMMGTMPMPGMEGMMTMMDSIHRDLAAMTDEMPGDMADRIEQMQSHMDAMMAGLGGMDHSMLMSGTMPMSGTMAMTGTMAGVSDMGDMAAMHAEMDTMLADMQSIMDDMMADPDSVTPEMAAEMGRMMGRMEGMADMAAMMEQMGGMMGGMMEEPE